MKFYQCAHCGNLAVKLHDSGVSMVCCGHPMQEVTPGMVEASTEKHLPLATRNGAEAHVQVGLESHPMSHKHHIRWILLETDRGVAIRFLPPEGEPAATFPLAEEEVLTAVYADCNLHGLWETPL